MVKIDPENHAVYVAHATMLKLKSFNQKLEKKDEAKTLTVVVGLELDNNELTKSSEHTGKLLNMGALYPFDVTSGSLQKKYQSISSLR